MDLGRTDTEKLRAVDARRPVEFLILHLKETLTTDGLISPLDRLNLLTEDGQAHLLTDQVRVGSKLDQVCVNVTIAKLAD